MNKNKNKNGDKSPRRFGNRQRNTARYQLSKDVEIDYKNIQLLQKFVTDRGKIVSRRVSGVSAKNQRLLNGAIKHARYLALLPVGGVKK